MKTSLVGHGMKDEDTKTHKIHTYISHSGFLNTHVGTLTHCTRLKTSLVGHGLKDEGIKTKTFHTVAL